MQVAHLRTKYWVWLVNNIIVKVSLRRVNMNSLLRHEERFTLLWLFLFFWSEFAVLEFDFCCAWFEAAKKVLKTGKESKFIFHLASYPRTEKSVLFSILTVWPWNKEKTRNWNHQKPATEIMLLLQKTMITTANVKKNLNRETLYSFPIQIQRKYSIFNLILSLTDWLLKKLFN